MLSRRDFFRAASGSVAAGLLPDRIWGGVDASLAKITRIEIVRYRGSARTEDHLEIASDTGAVGRFGPLGWGIPRQFRAISAQLAKLIIARDALDRELEFLAFWEALYPNRPLTAYATGIDPLTRRKIWGTTRGDRQRHSQTGVIIMTLSAVENALWDLRGKLRNEPVHRLVGTANRRRLDVYTRVGEGRNLEQSRRRARDLYDRGCKHQKWYFVHARSDGDKGMRANLELVRV
ncbi:MAG: enolase-like domain-containing protein, partial [Planctomycetota bacterium]